MGFVLRRHGLVFRIGTAMRSNLAGRLFGEGISKPAQGLYPGSFISIGGLFPSVLMENRRQL
jgi:hypothetical protein